MKPAAESAISGMAAQLEEIGHRLGRDERCTWRDLGDVIGRAESILFDSYAAGERQRLEDARSEQVCDCREAGGVACAGCEDRTLGPRRCLDEGTQSEV